MYINELIIKYCICCWCCFLYIFFNRFGVNYMVKLCIIVLLFVLFMWFYILLVLFCKYIIDCNILLLFLVLYNVCYLMLLEFSCMWLWIVVGMLLIYGKV